jgi:hypothetical protein
MPRDLGLDSAADPGPLAATSAEPRGDQHPEAAGSGPALFASRRSRQPVPIGGANPISDLLGGHEVIEVAGHAILLES